MPPNPVVAFGSSENSFYIGCGLKYYAPGVPLSLANTIQKLPAMNMAWLSIDGEAQAWVARDKNSGTTHYSTNLPNRVVEALKGDAEYVTLGPTKNQYFVKLKGAEWIGELHDGATKGYNEIRETIGIYFDTALTGMIFGKGDTMLYTVQIGFTGWTDREAKGSNLEKLLLEYLKGNEWQLEPGSSLCQWNINYFYLIFKNKASGDLRMRWNLPETMQTKLMELREYADSAPGQLAILTHQQTEANLATERVRMASMLEARRHETTMSIIDNMGPTRRYNRW